MAVDVGTTTIAVQLIDLAVAQIVAARSDYNDQIRLRPGRDQPDQLRPQPRSAWRNSASACSARSTA